MNIEWIKITVLFLGLAFFAVSCNTKSKVSEEKKSEIIENPLENGYLSATVALGTKCKVQLRADSKGTQTILVPISGMDDEFMIDGLEVFVQFNPSRAPQPEGCRGQVIVVTDIILK